MGVGGARKFILAISRYVRRTVLYFILRAFICTFVHVQYSSLTAVRAASGTSRIPVFVAFCYFLLLATPGNLFAQTSCKPHLILIPIFVAFDPVLSDLWLVFGLEL